MNSLMCKTMYWSERALLNGYIFIFRTRIKPSTVSLTCCDLHIFAIWISFCSFCWANFQESIWEGTTTSIIWNFSIFCVSCMRDVCTPTGSFIQVVSATFGSWLVVIPKLDFFRASAVSAAFFFQNISVVLLLMEKFYGHFQYLLRCECFQSKCVLQYRVPHSWYEKSQPNSSTKVGLPVRTWLFLHLVLREMLCGLVLRLLEVVGQQPPDEYPPRCSQPRLPSGSGSVSYRFSLAQTLSCTIFLQPIDADPSKHFLIIAGLTYFFNQSHETG